MTKSKHTKKALLMSLLSIVLCLSMLIGSTFAWFTDSVTSGNNKIVAGNLDIEMEYAKYDPETKEMSDWNSVKDAKDLFDPNALWEPGHTEVVYIRITNKGTLALTYKLSVKAKFEQPGTNVAGEPFKLSDYLVFGHADMGETLVTYADRAAARAAADANKAKLNGYTSDDTLLPDEMVYGALVVYMPESVGNEANYRNPADYQTLAAVTPDYAPYIELAVDLQATQAMHENDSFGDTYDEDAAAAILSWGDDTDESYQEDEKTKTITITSEQELAALAARVNAGDPLTGYTVKLDADLDLAGRTWVPIGRNKLPFNGTFDGQNHTVSNLTIINDRSNSSANAYVGLIGYGSSNTVIKDVVIDGATACGYLGVSAVCGGGSTIKQITNVTVKGDVQLGGGDDWYVGAMFGYGYVKEISNCHVEANEGSLVSGETYIGGIVGFCGEGVLTLSNCSSNIDVSGYSCAGGISGILHYGNTIDTCEVKDVTVTTTNNAISGRDYKSCGAIAGVYVDGSTATIKNCTGTATLVSNNGTDNEGLIGTNFGGVNTDNLVLTDNTVDVTISE